MTVPIETVDRLSRCTLCLYSRTEKDGLRCVPFGVKCIDVKSCRTQPTNTIMAIECAMSKLSDELQQERNRLTDNTDPVTQGKVQAYSDLIAKIEKMRKIEY